MKIDMLLDEMIHEAANAAPGTWKLRHAADTPDSRLMVGVEAGSGRRALLLPCAGADLPPRREWPFAHGLDVQLVRIGGLQMLAVLLREISAGDVFVVLAEDVLPRVNGAATASQAITVLLARLGRWKKFLAAGSEGLSVTQQRGLYAELLTLRGWYLTAIPATHAVQSWTGPTKAAQDFQCGGVAVEVKSTVDSVPVAVRISGARQLDDVGLSIIFLRVLLLDERMVEESSALAGQSLKELVSLIRNDLAGHPSALDQFEDLLLDVGYFSRHETSYSARRYTVRDDLVYRVSDGFPRLLERDLPIGIGDVDYVVTLAACQQFRLSEGDVVTSIRTAAMAAVSAGDDKGAL